jgi:hypothetical protein
MFKKILAKLYRIPTWETKDGEVLKITEMTNSHLRNVLILLLKKAKYLKVLERYLTADISKMGDGALDCFMMEFDNLLEKDWRDSLFDRIENRDCKKYLPDIFYSIRNELKKRGENILEFEFEEVL